MNLFTIFREILAFIWYVLASLIGVLIRIGSVTGNKKTVVIVHGIGAQPLAFIFLKRYLERCDINVVFFDVSIPRSLGFGVKSIDELAEDIKEFFLKNNLTNVSLIGMSAGGVISLIFLEKFMGWKYVNKFIAISSSFKGGWLSFFMQFLAPLSSRFKPNGDVTKEISNLVLKHPEKIVTITGKWDEFVEPLTSKLNGVRNIVTNEGGHAFLQTFSKKTFEKITEELS